MNLLPPFFNYARRIDKSNVIELIYKRLGSVDDYGNGFVGNTFKTILESEINLKSKIVDDFALNLKPNPLDYTLGTHTMKLKTDYLLLVTKLYGYLDHWGILEKEIEKVSKIPASQKITEKVIPQTVCSLKISIECANNIKNP